jgi:hypothetical protein
MQIRIRIRSSLLAALWIRVGFSADPVYLNADPDTDPIQEAIPMRIRIKILVRLLSHIKLNFYIFNRSKNIHTKVQKAESQVY